MLMMNLSARLPDFLLLRMLLLPFSRPTGAC
jgi:hypothetical protein